MLHRVRCVLLAVFLFATVSASAARAQEAAPPAAPELKNFEDLAKRIDSFIPWASDGVELKDNNFPFMPKRRRPASRPTSQPAGGAAPVADSQPAEIDRSALLDGVLADAKKKNRLVLWYVPAIAPAPPTMTAGHMYRGALTDQYMREVIWSDPEVRDLVVSKFVPVRALADKTLGNRFGVKALEYVEPAVVVLDPDGKVLHITDRIRTFSADWMFHVLRGVLEKHPEYNRPIETVGKDQVAKAVNAVMGGDYEIAKAACAELQNSASADERAIAHLFLAHIAYRRHDAAGAEKELGLALASAKTPFVLGCVATARMRLAAARGDAETVVRGLDGDAKSDGNPRRAEAYYVAAVHAMLLGKTQDADALLVELCAKHTESPWAAKAAMQMVLGLDTTKSGAARHNYESFVWQEAPTYGPARSTHGLLGRTSPVARAGLAVDFLLDHQDPAGRWSDARYAFWDTPKIMPNVWMSATALASAALLEWRHLAPDRVDKALAAAEAYMADDKNIAAGRNEQCYADAYRLLYYSKRATVAADAKVRRAFVERMDQVIDDLAKLQDKHGSWAHEYKNPFTTGAVVQCLHMARAAGAHVPDDMLNRASEALLLVRNEKDGTYSYGQPQKADKKQVGKSTPKDAMARMPVCEGALFLNQKAEAAAVDRALANWWQNLERFETIRKCDFHSDGELGGFFFWHAFFHTSETAKILAEAARSSANKQLLEHLLRIQEMDGTWIDSHELGKSYGTAMGLLTLKNVLPNEQ